MNLHRLCWLLLGCLALSPRGHASTPAASAPTSASVASTGKTAADELAAQATLADALRWLGERHPLGSAFEDDPEFFYEADDVAFDQMSGLLLVAYRADSKAATDWLAWLGLDEDRIVVLIEGVSLN